MAISVPNVVKANATASGATSISTSGVSTTTGSTFLIVAICEAGVTPSFSDNKGNSYASRIGSIQTEAGNMAMECRYVQNGTGGAGHTATVTFSSTVFGCVFFLEIAGAATASYDSAATAQAASTSGSPFAVTSGTPAQANNAVISFCASDAGGTLTYAASGFTVIQETDGNTYWTGAVGYKLITAAAAETASWTVGASGALRTIAVFKEASGGAGTNVAPGAGSVALSGFVPTVARTANQSLAPAAGSLGLTGFAPTVARTANQALTPSAGAMTLAGFAPTVAQSNGVNLQPGAGALVISGPAPTVARTANQALIPSVGSVALTGFAPSVVQAAGSVALVPGAGVLQITGFAPSVMQSAQDDSHGGGIDPGERAFYRYTPPQKKKRERDWLDRDEPEVEPAARAINAGSDATKSGADATAAQQSLVDLLIRSGLSLMQAQEQLAERMEAQRAAALIQMAREIALQDEDDIAALLLML